MLRYIFLTFHTRFKPLYSHPNPTKSLHIEKKLVFDYGYSDNSEFSETSEFVLRGIPSSELTFFTQYVKTITLDFIMTRGLMLGGENSEFQVIVFFLPFTQ